MENRYIDIQCSFCKNIVALPEIQGDKYYTSGKCPKCSKVIQTNVNVVIDTEYGEVVVKRATMTNDKINDLIDIWHKGESEKPLHEFLGMTWDEYSDWLLERPESDKQIDSKDKP